MKDSSLTCGAANAKGVPSSSPRFATSLKFIASLALTLTIFTGCESTNGGGSVSGSIYYGVGFYDPWYYGGYYDDPDIIVTPPPTRPERPIPPPGGERPIPSPRPEQPIARPPSAPTPAPRPMPSIPSAPRPMPRPATRR
jgi:hypothetical protein